MDNNSFQSYIHNIIPDQHHTRDTSQRPNPQASSKRIHKLRILPIRQIQPLLILQLDILRLSPQQRFLRVLSLAVPVDEQHVEQAHAPACNDGDFCRDVAGSVAGAESLGADDVADAVWRGRVSGGFWGDGGG